MKLKTKLSLTFALVVLITVSLISLLSNVFINREFKKYIIKQQEVRTQEIVGGISAQYNAIARDWDLSFVHAIGMYALEDGYIIRVSDAQDRVLWDAEECDMASCVKLINNVSERMKKNCPQIKGSFIDKSFPLSQNGRTVGTVNISYYGPYFLSENDFDFLGALNLVLFSIGVTSLLLSVVVGWLLSKRISAPIVRAAKAARQMVGGDYAARLEALDNTKELMELADSVNHLAGALGCQESLRKQLTADVAHELRTPITSVQTHLEAMIEGLWEATPERLTSCHEEVTRISTLVSDLENLASVDNDKVELNKRPISLSQILDKAIGSFEMDIQSKDISVALSGDAPEVLADEDRIRQAVVNLLSNAIKYTPHGGHINITLSNTEKYVTLSIADDGVGIPENELPFIFERFYRADKSRNRKTGGSGIGLAVVKAIALAHGGKVEAESRVDSGSCFKVMLPLRTLQR